MGINYVMKRTFDFKVEGEWGCGINTHTGMIKKRHINSLCSPRQKIQPGAECLMMLAHHLWYVGSMVDGVSRIFADVKSQLNMKKKEELLSY